MNFARSEMSDHKFGCAILCEGQLDVIAMHAAGFSNSVAAEGTAFTPEQAKMLRRYTGKIKLALDSDAAGTKAVFRDAEILLPLGFEIKVVRFPGGKDPDELMKQQGKAAIAEAVENAADFFDFAVRELSGKNGDSPAGKAETAKEMLRMIALLESEAAKSAYVAWLANALKINADGLYAELVRVAKKEAEQRERYARYEQEKTPVHDAPPRETKEQKRYKKALFEILDVLLKYEEAAALAVEQIPTELLDQEPFSIAINEVIQAKMLEEWSDAPNRIIEQLEQKNMIDDKMSLLLMGGRNDGESQPEESTGSAGESEKQTAEQKKLRQEKKLALQVLAEDIRVLKEFRLKEKMEHIMEQFSRMPQDDPGRIPLLQEFSSLTKERAALQKK